LTVLKLKILLLNCPIFRGGYTNGTTTSLVYLSANIDHQIQKDELLNVNHNIKEKAYYVYENGIKGYDWLWHYADLLSLKELL
jgi:hypothetical protein